MTSSGIARDQPPVTAVQVALSLQNITKEFHGTRVLDSVSFDVRSGSVHAVLGANGAGKSTLVKILSGYHTPSGGSRVELWGKELRLPILDGESRGLGIVHQDLGLVDRLSVAENMAAGRRWRGRGAVHIRWGEEYDSTRQWLARLDVGVDPRSLVAGLTPAQRALVAVARTLRRMEDCGQERVVLLLDEPSAYLPVADAESLLARLR